MPTLSPHPLTRALGLIGFILLILAPIGSAQKLTSLSFPGRDTLTPAFDPNVWDYILEVENVLESVNFRASNGAFQVNYRINGGAWKTTVTGDNRVELPDVETTLEVTPNFSSYYRVRIRKPFIAGTRMIHECAPMRFTRARLTASLLPDEKVMVVGGTSYASQAPVVEIYDPATDQWSTGPAIPFRFSHIQETLQDGRILVAGGWSSPTVPLTDSYVYNPTSGMWTEVGSLHTGFTAAPTTSLLLNDGRVLVFHGPHAELFDPTTATWSAAADVPYPSGGSAATKLADGRVLVTGGYPLIEGGDVATNFAARIYDPTSGQWTLTTQMPIGRYVHTSSLLLDGRVLLTAGWASPLASHATSSIYDPATASWSSLPTVSQRWEGTQRTLSDGSVIVFGGGSSNPNLLYETFDPETETWTKGLSHGPMPSRIPSLLLSGDRVLFIGGIIRPLNQGGSNYSDAVYSWEKAHTDIVVTQGSETIAPSSTIIFDDTIIQNSTTKTVTITNSGTEPVDISVDSIVTTPVTTMYVTTDLYHTEPALTTLPAGAATTIDVTYTPWRDLNTATATLYITTQSGNSPRVAIPIYLQGTALSGSPLYEAWEQTVGFTGERAGPNESFHSDGVDNLHKYAFNMGTDRPDATVMTPGGTSGLPLITVLPAPSKGRTFRVEFVRRKGAGLLYIPQYSPDLGSFHNLNGTTTVTPIDHTWDRVVIESTYYNKFAFARILVRMQ
jgi:N-acetylneuraminic acid mutarotase